MKVEIVIKKKRSPFKETKSDEVHLEEAARLLKDAEEIAADTPPSLPQGRFTGNITNSRGEQVESSGRVQSAPPSE